MKQIIKENKLAYLMINYVDTKRISQEDFDKIIALDVTQTKRFSEWIVNQFITNPGIESLFPELGNAIKAYVKFGTETKDIKYKNMNVENFIENVKTVVTTHLKPKIKQEISNNLNQYKVGTVMGHTIYVLKKGAVEVNAIFNNFPNLQPDITSIGAVIYVTGNGTSYVVSFAADTFVDSAGNSIPIKSQNVELWDNIFTWLYTKNYVQEDIISCVDLFGEYLKDSKLFAAIAQHNPQKIFGDYYSKESNKLMNLIVHTDQLSVTDYAKYVESFKNLGFGLKGILVNINLGSSELAEIKANINEEEYESQVKAHFKRTGQSFDSTTFEKIKQSFATNATLFFLILRDTEPTNGIFLESGNNIIGFVDKTELSHVMTKFHSARKIKSIITQLPQNDESKRGEYDRQLKNVQGDIEKIIDTAKLLKHYIIF